MPETVCVTVEQLREIEKAGVGSWQYEQSGCPACGAEFPDLEYYVRDENGDYLYDDDGARVELEEPVQPLMDHASDCWLADAIAQAERLKGWQPKVGDRVRVKAMPEVGSWTVIAVREDKSFPRASGQQMHTILRIALAPGIEEWRYLAELMPEEAE